MMRLRFLTKISLIGWLFLLLSLSVESVELKAQEKPLPTFENPRDTMSYFLAHMKDFQKSGKVDDLDLAIKAFDLSETDPTSRVQTARLAAKNLIKTLNRIETIELEKVPENYLEDSWFYRRRQLEVDNKNLYVEIAIGESEYRPEQTFNPGLEIKEQKNKSWLFTPKTVETIGHFARALRHKKLVSGATELKTWKETYKSYMPSWMGERTFLFLNGQWIGIVILLLLAFLADKIFNSYLRFFTRRILKRRNLLFSEEQQQRLNRPLALIIFALFWNAGTPFLEFSDSVLAIFLRGGKIVFTIGFVVTTYHLVDVFAYYLEAISQIGGNKFSDILIPLVRKAGKTVVVILGVVVIGNSLTLDMKSLVAGLGIGGIAFALAAKDSLSNFFGSLTVLLDRPFYIGDWVNIGGGNLEGIVEEVGLRSTRIRTFYDSLITVPNGQLTNAHIDNYGMRQYRRYSTPLSLQYDTPPEKIEAFCEGIRELIKKHPHTRKDYYQVHFNHFNNYSLDVLLYVFWKVPGWAEELTEKHKLLVDILKLAKDLDIRFAFPTQTLHMFDEEHRPYKNGNTMGPEAGVLAAEKTWEERAKS